MTATENAQSLAEFVGNSLATIDRLKQSGEAEFITVDGEPRAVLMSADLYVDMVNEWNLARDVEAIDRSIQEGREGKGQLASESFKASHARLLAMQAAQANGAK